MAHVPGLYRRGNIWWCKCYVNGRPVRESTGTEKETAVDAIGAQLRLPLKIGRRV